MNSEAIIRTKCYLCDGPIEFPAELTNQIIPCPHCQKEIKLFGVSKSAPFWQSAWAKLGPPWNRKQKILTALFVLGFVVSLFTAASWEIRYRAFETSFDQVQIRTGSVFTTPDTGSMTVTGSRLLVMPLFFTWVALVAVYGILLWVFKALDTILVSEESQWKALTLGIVIIAVAFLMFVFTR